MASALDVAAYILAKKGPITAMKLQKLVYYSQAWSLVIDEAPLFRNHVEAWANGPVVPSLYREHKGKFTVSRGDIVGDKAALTAKQRKTVNAVLKHYGNKTSQWLSDLTHAERPWKEARNGLRPGQRGHVRITDEEMAAYYGSL